jgi:hypothetical protein
MTHLRADRGGGALISLRRNAECRAKKNRASNSFLCELRNVVQRQSCCTCAPRESRSSAKTHSVSFGQDAFGRHATDSRRQARDFMTRVRPVDENLPNVERRDQLRMPGKLLGNCRVTESAVGRDAASCRAGVYWVT